MKNFSLFLFALLFTFSIYGQQVNRNYVVVEIGTGTWCTYCPGAAMGADDLVENGHHVAIIENHNGDSYAYTASNARNTYYGITGFPTAFFDGGNSVVGGSHTQSMYGSYLPIYNNSIAVLSDFTMDVSATHNGLDYDVTIDVNEVGNYTGTNLVIQLAITESHIEENWQGQTELNFVSRGMYPTHTGTSYTGGSSTINLSFTADAAWDLSNCELVAFIQDNTSKAILQSDKLTLAEPTGTNNVAITGIVEIPDLCTGNVAPILKVKNFGSTDITSLAIDYSINSGATTGTFNWSGAAIPFNQFASIQMDEIAFDLLADNTIDFEISTVNGISDDDPLNNTGSSSFSSAPEATTIVNLELHTDGWGTECTWNIKNSSGTIIYSGGPYGNNQTITAQFYLDLDCYSFNLIDSYGDGGGAVTLEDSEGTVLYYTSGGYGSGETQLFNTFSVLPEVAFIPINGATNVNVSGNISITFNQPMRLLDNSTITNTDIYDFVNLTDPNKGAIAFTGTINTSKTLITLDPNQDLPGLTEITVTVIDNSIETNFDDALAESSSSFTTDAGIGVNEILKNIQIYPNPANDFLTISGAQHGNLIISDVFGKQIIKQNIENNTELVNLNKLNSGVYIIIIDLNNIQIKHKFTVVK